MAAKGPDLAERLKKLEEKQQPKLEVVETDSTDKKKVPPSRVDKKHIGGYFDEAVYRQVKLIGVDKGMTTQDILADALNGFFERNGKATIA